LHREQLLPCDRFQKALPFEDLDEKAGLLHAVKNFGYDQTSFVYHIFHTLPLCNSFIFSTSFRLCYPLTQELILSHSVSNFKNYGYED